MFKQIFFFFLSQKRINIYFFYSFSLEFIPHSDYIFSVLHLSVLYFDWIFFCYDENSLQKKKESRSKRKNSHHSKLVTVQHKWFMFIQCFSVFFLIFSFRFVIQFKTLNALFKQSNSVVYFDILFSTCSDKIGQT